MKPLLVLRTDKRVKIYAGPATAKYFSQDGNEVSTNGISIYDLGEGGQVILSVNERTPEPVINSKIIVWSHGGGRFEATILEVSRLREKAGMLVWILSEPRRAQQDQKRGAFRVSASLQCQVEFVAEEGPIEAQDMTVTDLSCTGFCLVINSTRESYFSLHRFTRGKHHHLSFTPPEDFLQEEVPQIIERRTRGEHRKTDIRPESVRQELQRSFEDVLFRIERVQIVKRRFESEVLYRIGCRFEAELLAINRLVAFIQRQIGKNPDAEEGSHGSHE